MGSGFSQLLRNKATSSAVLSDTLTIEVQPLVQREEMATRRPVETAREHHAFAASRLTLELVTKFMNSSQDLQDLACLLPSVLEYQEELEAKISSLQNRERMRHAVSEDHAHVSESSVENISSSSRPSSLEMKFQDFYDHQRVDAIDVIERSRRTSNDQFEWKNNEMMDNRIACVIFEEAYKAALDSKNSFLEDMSLILTDAPRIGASHFQGNHRDAKTRDSSITIKIEGRKTSSLSQGVVNHLKLIMKETSDTCDISALVQRVEEELKARQKHGKYTAYESCLFSKPEINKYIMECCEYAWKLVCQTPPYVLETQGDVKESNRIFDPSRHQICRDVTHPGGYSGLGQLIQRVVWPGLSVGSPPRVIHKTEVTLEDYV